MLFRLSFFLLFIIPFNAFTQNPPCPAGEIFEFITESRLKDTIIILGADTINTKLIKKGNGYVFRYVQMFGCPDREDDDISEVLKWEVPDSSSEFVIYFTATDSMPQNLTYVYVSPGWPGRRKYNKAVVGKIEGFKQEKTWIIKGTLQVEVIKRGKIPEGNKDIVFSGNFIEWDQGIKITRKHKKISKEYF